MQKDHKKHRERSQSLSKNNKEKKMQQYGPE